MFLSESLILQPFTPNINEQHTYIINTSPTLPINRELPIPNAEVPVLTMPDQLVDNQHVQEWSDIESNITDLGLPLHINYTEGKYTYRGGQYSKRQIYLWRGSILEVTNILMEGVNTGRDKYTYGGVNTRREKYTYGGGPYSKRQIYLWRGSILEETNILMEGVNTQREKCKCHMCATCRQEGAHKGHMRCMKLSSDNG